LQKLPPDLKPVLSLQDSGSSRLHPDSHLPRAIRQTDRQTSRQTDRLIDTEGQILEDGETETARQCIWLSGDPFRNERVSTGHPRTVVSLSELMITTELSFVTDTRCGEDIPPSSVALSSVS